MTTPPPYYPPPAASPANDKTTLWGVLGIVFGVCCPPVGVIFGVLSLMEARKAGKPPTLAYVAFAVAAISIVLGIIFNLSGTFNNLGTTGS